jgi:hypothetical protein
MAQNIQMPYRGINKGVPVDKIPTEYSPHMDNVRPRDVLEGRIRMGQRPGLGKWSTDQIGGAEQPVVAMISVSFVESPS